MTGARADTIAAFRAAMIAAGIDATAATIAADGALHRFHVAGDKPGSLNGWYVLHADATPAGKFGHWRTGEEHAWRGAGRPQASPTARAQHAQAIAALQARRAQERLQRHETAALRARALWDTSPPAGRHAYLDAKGIAAHDLRQRDGRLLVPLRDAAGVLWNLQFIGANGGKRFLYGGRCAGLFHLVGNPAGAAVLCIAEGYATAASVHEATGHPCAVAFSAGNLAAVALTLRAQHPAARIVVCADDDAETAARIGKNPGITAARAAAAAVGGSVAYPPTDTTRDRPTRQERSA